MGIFVETIINYTKLISRRTTMTYYPELGFSSCQVAGAVAEAALHDLRVNNFGFPGFPQINVSDDPDGSFIVVLRWNKASSTQFQLSQAEAKAAVKKFKAGTGDDPALFNKVQKAVLDLEIKASRYPTS
jgi:hypothetical protein